MIFNKKKYLFLTIFIFLLVSCGDERDERLENNLINENKSNRIINNQILEKQRFKNTAPAIKVQISNQYIN